MSSDLNTASRYMKVYRANNPEYTTKAKKSALARGRALERLARRNRVEFLTLVAEERRLLDVEQ